MNQGNNSFSVWKVWTSGYQGTQYTVGYYESESVAKEVFSAFFSNRTAGDPFATITKINVYNTATIDGIEDYAPDKE